MGLYTLVASRYDRVNARYLDEVKIQLEGGPNNKLMQIDAYTSSGSKMELLNELKEKKLIANQDTLSIRYIKDNNSKAIYYRVIYDNQKFQTCFKSLTKRNYYDNGRLKISDALRYDNEYFKEEWAKLKQLIIEKKEEEIKLLYPKENKLMNFIHNYLKSFYDNDLEKEKDLEKIKEEFSRYKTFRGWVVATSKHISKTTVYPTKPKVQEMKRKEPISIEAAEIEYEKKIETITGVSYNKYLADNYNRRDLDNEEFLEESEMDQVHGKNK